MLNKNNGIGKIANTAKKNGFSIEPLRVTKKLNSSPQGLPNMDLICYSHLRWHFVFQRPQHIMSRFAKEQRVFFVEEPIIEHREDDTYLVTTTEENVRVVTPHLRPGLTEEQRDMSLTRIMDTLCHEHQITEHIAWYLTPMALPFSAHKKPSLTVYDCMDELSAFKGAPPALLDNEEKLMERADLVFTGGVSLYEHKKERHANIHPFPSSIDRAHFASGAGKADPNDQKDIAHPRIGFFGVIDERLDIGLLKGAAEQMPDWQFVMIGPVVKIDPETLPKLPNIHYLGGRDYKELPSYLAHWDVAMLPFSKNESTRFISPTKTPEYLCAMKPVVSTSVKDVVRPYGEKKLVHIADDAATFAEAAKAALQQKDDKEWQKKVDEFLNSNFWELTYSNMRKKMGTTYLSLTEGGTDEIEKHLKDISNERNLIFDYLIVGAGFAGSVLAERLASNGKKVLIMDKRDHIAGNAFDHYDDAGVLVHKYGPHIFHTNSKDVFDYLSQFTEWRNYQHRVLASVDGMEVPIPINLDTINKLYGTSFTASDLESFFESVAEPKDKLLTSEDVVVSKVGRELYEKFFRGYTRKQWGLDPSELNASVTARVPTRTNRDDRYFTDTYQAMPKHGYTRMFQKMLSHPNIKVMLNTDYREIKNMIPYKELIFTGPIDEYFDYRYGKLPYRSLQFKFETHDREKFQETGTVNYPNEQAYTRITEFKYLTGQDHKKTSIVYEFPKAEGDPYYPIPRKDNEELYQKYKKLAKEIAPDVHFVGRLATYKYYNMDQVVAQPLSTFKKLSGEPALMNGETKALQDA